MAIAYQKQLLTNSVEVQEKERSRIAADLHDDLIGQLHRIKLMNSNSELNKLLGNSISTARRISHDLTPPLLDEIELPELMEDFVLPFKSKLAINFESRQLAAVPLDVPTKLNLFRIVQELVINTIKHAKANQLNVQYRTSQQQVILYLKDDGVGISTKAANGIGVKNIELRAQALNARFRLKAGKRKGTNFILILKTNQL